MREEPFLETWFKKHKGNGQSLKKNPSYKKGYVLLFTIASINFCQTGFPYFDAWYRPQFKEVDWLCCHLSVVVWTIWYHIHQVCKEHLQNFCVLCRVQLSITVILKFQLKDINIHRSVHSHLENAKHFLHISFFSTLDSVPYIVFLAEKCNRSLY
jgi:hypothetical protein